MGTLKANRGGGIGEDRYLGRLKYARGYYDFATDGGAVSTIALRGDKIPSGAIILQSYVNVATGTTSGGAATVSIGVETATDLRAANAHDNATTQLSTTGNKLTLNTRAAVPLATTADRDISIAIGTAALTAGRFSVLVEYIELAARV